MRVTDGCMRRMIETMEVTSGPFSWPNGNCGRTRYRDRKANVLVRDKPAQHELLAVDTDHAVFVEQDIAGVRLQGAARTGQEDAHAVCVLPGSDDLEWRR